MVPSCTPKKSKCKGVLVSIDTSQTCTVSIIVWSVSDGGGRSASEKKTFMATYIPVQHKVTGTYKNTGKKQSLTGIAISGPSECPMIFILF